MMSARRPRTSARWRLTFTYSSLFVFTGAALLTASYFLVKHRETRPATDVAVLCKQTADRANNLQIAGYASGPSGVPLTGGKSCAVAIESQTGSIFFRSGSAADGSSSSASGGNVTHVSTSQGPSVTLPGPLPPVVLQASQLKATVAAAQAHTLDSFELEGAIALAAMTLASIVLSWWIAGRVLRPVHRITDAARRLSEETLHDRINLQGPDDELKELADTFDAMLGRLDRAFSSQRRFVANASHELRTPLATERVLIDEALANRSARPDELRTILEQLRANSEETERLIEALLVLARSERGVDRQAVHELATMARAAVAGCAAEAARRGVEVRTDLVPVTVSGDQGLLERLAGNVVENAVRHNFTNGWVEVTTKRAGALAFLEVTNTGPTITEATIATLTEPFRRGSHDRSTDDGGFGLGLSIVDAVVSAHHGVLLLRPRPGGGLVVRVQLPVAAAATQMSRSAPAPDPAPELPEPPEPPDLPEPPELEAGT